MKELVELMALMGDLNKSVGGVKEGQDSLIERVNTVDKNITGMESRVRVIEESNRTKAIPSVPGVNAGKEKFSLQRMAYAIASKDWRDAKYEDEVIRACMTKALSVGTTTAGGFLVPAEAITELVELIRAKTVTRELGATVLDGLIGSPVEIPTQTGGATMYWVGENAAITESQETTGQISMTPNQASVLVKMSNRLIRLSNPSAERMVREDMARVLALGIDLAALRGSGSANQPTGIANTGSILTVAIGTDGGVPSIANLESMLYQMELANTDNGKMGWALHPRTWNTLRALKDAENRYYLRPDLAKTDAFTLLGYPIRKTTQIPINLVKGSSGSVCSEIYLGNWQELIIAMWGGLEFMASQETSDAFAKNQTWIRVIQEIDIALRHAESFCLVNDAKAS
ncbi:hypothetical protein LCGC14_2150270 [marine sediment metagenome]|uniref:Phage capsid-like C-terminal domain-containing protein n=1 Tax=marine sediment metagenome TaxID=412755 RepID=A0A0F9DVX4_9ZZZZ